MSDSSLQKTLYCNRSGVPLATVTLCIVEGAAPYMDGFSSTLLLHPFYSLSSIVLTRKLTDALTAGEEKEWDLSPLESQRICLLTSAIMWNLEAIKQDRPSLPSLEVAVGSSSRLLALAKWYWFVSSQRLAFPVYSVSGKNSNLHWENYKHWLDSAFEIREAWANKSRELKREEELKATEETLDMLRHRVYKRLDLKKVWRWIELQASPHVSAGRLATLKDLFLEGDMQAHEWLVDDVDDLREILCDYCDLGNEIVHFIQERLNAMAALIRDYYGGFTLLSTGSQDSFGNSTEGHTPQELDFLAEYDAKVAELQQLPEEPKRKDFATTGLFLKAQASWSILRRRWEASQKRQAAQAATDSTSSNPAKPPVGDAPF